MNYFGWNWDRIAWWTMAVIFWAMILGVIVYFG